MSETLATSTNRNEAIPTTEQMDLIVNGPQAPEAEDTRELSHPANVLRRVADFFEQRKTNKLHSQALKEYRTEHHSDYVDHIAKLAESDSEQISSYGESQVDREQRRADRQEMIDKATHFARATGSAALETAKTAGLVTLGVSIMAGEQAYKGAKVAVEKTKDAVEFGTQGYYDTVEGIKDTLRDARDTAVDTVTDARDAVIEKAVDIRDAIKDKLIAAKNRALDRRAARRAKWGARKDAVLTWVNDTKEQAIYAGNLVAGAATEIASTLKDNGKEIIATARQEGQRFVGETASRVSTARAAGSAALEAYAATTQAHKEQNKL